MVQQKHTNVDFRETIFEKLHASHQICTKNNCSDIIHSRLINLIIYNNVQLKSINNHIHFDKTHKTMIEQVGKQPPLKLKSGNYVIKEIPFWAHPNRQSWLPVVRARGATGRLGCTQQPDPEILLFIGGPKMVPKYYCLLGVPK